MNEAELGRFRRGDPELFRALVETESPQLVRYATGLCGDPDRAADLAQETWIRAYEKRTAFRGDSPLLSWLIAICRSIHLAAHRTAARRAELRAANPGETGVASEGPVGAASASAGAGARTETDALARRRLAEALADLPDRQRDVVVLRVVEGLSTRQCARRLGIPEGTVKSTLSRGLDALRPELEDLRE